MRIIGGIYMLYLAYQIYKMSESELNDEQAITFWGGFFMQLLNPKVVVFTMTIIPSFIMPYDTSIQVLSVSVLAVTIIGFLAFVTWVLFGTIF